MKFTTLSCLLAALCSATNVLADALQDSFRATITASPEATPAPELVNNAPQPHLEVRQGAAIVDPAASINPEQYPIATTQWLESTIDSTTTWISVIYTQTFASVPDQWYTAGTGTIGYGTLTKISKREEPVETGYAQPVVLEIHIEVVTQYVQPVTQLLILHTVTIVANATSNGTTFGSNTTFPSINGTTNSTMNMTTPRNTSSAASFSSLAYNYSTGTGTGFYLF